MNRRHLAALVALTSCSLIVIGVALVYVPAAFVVAGLAVGAVLFVDVGPTRKARS